MALQKWNINLVAHAAYNPTNAVRATMLAPRDIFHMNGVGTNMRMVYARDFDSGANPFKRCRTERA